MACIMLIILLMAGMTWGDRIIESGSTAAEQSPLCLAVLPRPADQTAAAVWNALLDFALPAPQAVGVRVGRLRLGMLLEMRDGTCSAVWTPSELSFRPDRGWYSRGMLYVQHAAEDRMVIAEVDPASGATIAAVATALREGIMAGNVSYGGVPGDVGAPGSGVVVVSVGPARSGDMLDGAAALAWARSASTPAVVVRQPVESMQLDTCSEQALGPAGRGTDAAAAFFRSVWADEASWAGRGGEAVGGTMGLACTHQLGQPLYPLRSVPHIVVHTLPALPPHPVPTAHGTTCPTTGLRWGMTEANIAATVASVAHPAWESAAEVPAWASDKPPRWRRTLQSRVLSARRQASGPWQVVVCSAGAIAVLTAPDSMQAAATSTLHPEARAQGLTSQSVRWSNSRILAPVLREHAAVLLNDTARRAKVCVDAGSWDPGARLSSPVHRRLSSLLAVFTPAVATLRSALTVVPWLTASSRMAVRGNDGAPAPGVGIQAKDTTQCIVNNEMDTASARSYLSVVALASMSLAPSAVSDPDQLYSDPPPLVPSMPYVTAWPDAPRAVAPSTADDNVEARVLCLEVDGFRDETNAHEPRALCSRSLVGVPAGSVRGTVPVSRMSPEMLHIAAGSHTGDVPSAILVAAGADTAQVVLVGRMVSDRLAVTRLVHAAGVPEVLTVRESIASLDGWVVLNASWHPDAAMDEPTAPSTFASVTEAVQRGAATLARDDGVTSDVNASVGGFSGRSFDHLSGGVELRAPKAAAVPAAWRRLRGLRARDDAVARRERRARRFRPIADDSAWPRLRGLRALAQASTLASAAAGFGRDVAGSGFARRMPQAAWASAFAGPSTPIDAAERFPGPYFGNQAWGRSAVAVESLLAAAASQISAARQAQPRGPLRSAVRLRYLEIGCRWDDVFDVIEATVQDLLTARLGVDEADAAVVEVQRFGVDPVQGGNLRMTSDAFFADPRFRSLRFHTVFIDGLHEAQQALRDVENSLARLEPGGAIMMHDLGAPSRRMELWPIDAYDVTDSALSGDGGHRSPWSETVTGWNGDTWRAMASLLTRPDVVAAIVEIDHGVGVVRRGRNPAPVVLPAPALPRSRTLGDDGMLDVVVGESASDRRSLEASGRRQIHAWSEDPAMAPGAVEALVGRPDATGQTPCDDDTDRLFTLLSLRHTAGTPTDAEVEQAVSEGEASMGRLFSSGRPLLTHPAVRCLRGQLGESRDDLRQKDAIDELAGVSGRVLGWTQWASTMGYVAERLAPSQVAEWLSSIEA